MKEEELPTPVFVDLVKESEPSKEEREDNGGREEESGAEDKTDLSRLDIHNVTDVYMQLDNPFGSIRLKSLHVNTLIDPIELDLKEVSIGLKVVIYSFSNTI